MRFGKYVLQDRIGAGGMAEVFRATTDGVGGFRKELAIKRILDRNASDDEFVRMFIDEAKITVSLRHPNIAEVYDLGCIDGAYFIALELVDGRNLADVLRAGKAHRLPLPRALSVHIAREVARGLYAAHSATDAAGQPLGIIHRDVSPQNVLLGFQGAVKLIDFGVAKARSKLVQTTAGTIRGKLLYMSPEQARALPMDGRSDLFSLGLLLYKLLVGHNPFEAPTEQEVMERLKSGYIAPLRSVDPAIEPPLAAAVHGALQRRPDDRPADAHALAVELGEVLQKIAPEFSPRDLRAYLRRLFGAEAGGTDEGVAAYTSSVSPPPLLGGELEEAPTPALVSSAPPVTGRPTETLPRPAVASERRASFRGSAGAAGRAPPRQPLPELAEELTELLRGPDTEPSRPPMPDAGQPTIPLNVFSEQPPALPPRRGGLGVVAVAGAAGLGLIALGLVAWFVQGRGVGIGTEAGGSGPVAPTAGLVVESIPAGATVELDGRLVHGAGAGGPQRTPARLEGLRPGEHTVRVLLPPHATWERRIDLPPGEMSRVRARLEAPRTGRLRVRTRPSGAAVFVDGAASGRTPVDLHDLPAGRPLRVLLLLSDHVAHAERVVVGPGTPGVLFVRMREARGPDSSP